MRQLTWENGDEVHVVTVRVICRTTSSRWTYLTSTTKWTGPHRTISSAVSIAAKIWSVSVHETLRLIYASLFAQKEQQARKQNCNKKQQQTNINKADRHLRILAQLRPWYHITCHATYESLLKKVFSVFFSGHRHYGSDSDIERKYTSRQFLLPSKMNYIFGCHWTGISVGIWLYECLFGKWLVKNEKISDNQ